MRRAAVAAVAGALKMVDSGAALVDAFGDWLTAIDHPDSTKMVAHTATFVRWRLDHSTGVLDAYDEDDVLDFLIDWLPGRYEPASDAGEICSSVGFFLFFLGESGRLRGGRERAMRLSTLATRLTATVGAVMAKPADVATVTAVFTHPMVNPSGRARYIELLADPSLSEDDLEAELESRITAYQGLSEDERQALLDEFLHDQSEPVELPFLVIPPAPEEVDAVAAQAPLLLKIDALREYLGEAGKPLTKKGNIKLADGKALTALLDTGDHMEIEVGDKTFRRHTTERLPGLQSIVNIAKQAGAVRVRSHRLMPVKSWPSSATKRGAAVYRAIIELGALSSSGNPYALIANTHDVLDDGTVHWLAGLLAPDSYADVDAIVEAVVPVLRGEIQRYWPQWADSAERLARSGISEICEMLQDAGVIEWTGYQEVVEFTRSTYSGGTIRLTALGRHVVPDSVAQAGYVLHRIDDLAAAPVSELMEALDQATDHERPAVVGAWKPTLDDAHRVADIVGFIASVDDSASRFKGFAALEFFDDAVVGPAVRELLDGPVCGSAALYLLARKLADEQEVGGFVDIGAFVDVLASSLADPGEMCEMFAAAPHMADQYAALEQIWRHPAPETAAVLDALGQHLPDPKLAKAARKAAIKHRSWMANRN